MLILINYFYLLQIIINHRVFYVYTHCPGPQRDTLNCVSGCTGSVTMEGYCKDSSFTEDWADLEGVTRFDISSTSTSVILQLVYTQYSYISYHVQKSVSQEQYKKTINDLYATYAKRFQCFRFIIQHNYSMVPLY